MSLNLFKEIFNEVKTNNIGVRSIEEKSILKPKGIVTIWENEKTDENILVHDNNLIVDSFFDIIVGLFLGDENKLINTLALGNGGVYDGVLQTPNVNNTDLYSLTFEKVGYESYSIENILDKYISFNFTIGKEEGNGEGNLAKVYSEMGLKSVDGTMFARKTFNEIVKTNEKTIFIEWRLQW